MTSSPKPRPSAPPALPIQVPGLEAHLESGAAPAAPAPALIPPVPLEAAGLLGGGLLGGDLPIGLSIPSEPSRPLPPGAPDTAGPEVVLAERPSPASWRGRALQAAANLRERGLQLHAEVQTISPDPSWGWTPMCAEEEALAYLAAGPLPMESLHRSLQGTRDQTATLVEGLVQKGLVSEGAGGPRATPAGQAVIAARLVELEPDQAVALGAAQMFGAAQALQAGSLDHLAYSQSILNLVNRGGDPERRLALLFVAAVAAEEATANLEPGAVRPEGLDELADYLRWTLPPGLRPLAEESLNRLQGAQALSDHWAALESARAAGPTTLLTYTASPATYGPQDTLSGLSTIRAKTAMSLQALAGEGLGTPRAAALIARSALDALSNGGAGEAPLHLDQALAVLSPVVATKAVLSQEDAREVLQRIQANRQEALGLAYQLVRPVLEARGYEVRLAERDLVALVAELGHALDKRELDHLRDAVRATARLDGSVEDLLGPVREAASPSERKEALQALALTIASEEASQQERPGAMERFGAAILTLGMISRGADAEDLERAHHAGALMAESQDLPEETRQEGARIAATTRTLLVGVAGMVPGSAGRQALLQEIDGRGLDSSNSLRFLQAVAWGEDMRLKASVPWPDSLPDANLAAFADAARLGELREAFTLASINPAWPVSAARVSDGIDVEGATFMLPAEEAPLGIARHEFIRQLATELPFRDYGLFVLARGPEPGARPHGVFLVEAEKDLPLVAALAGSNSFLCQLVKLGDNVSSHLVEEAKDALQRAGIAFSVYEISDEELSRAYDA